MFRGLRNFAICLSVLYVTPALAGDKLLATVNGEPITQQDLSNALADIGGAIPKNVDEVTKQRYLLNNLIELRLVANKGLADKLDHDPAFIRKLNYFREKLLLQAVFAKIDAVADTPSAEKAAYDAAAKAQPSEPEIHARHILLPDEGAAKAALARVKAGEDFAKVADEVSKDPAAKGGDLGWFTKATMVPAFADAAFKLKPGQISDPVHTQFGWHIIKLEDKRTKTFPPFDQVKADVVRYLQQKAHVEFVQGLLAKAKIDIKP